MRVAIGFKAHPGWAAVVAVGLQNEHVQLVDRRPLLLIDDSDEIRARQPITQRNGWRPSWQG